MVKLWWMSVLLSKSPLHNHCQSFASNTEIMWQNKSRNQAHPGTDNQFSNSPHHFINTFIKDHGALQHLHIWDILVFTSQKLLHMRSHPDKHRETYPTENVYQTLDPSVRKCDYHWDYTRVPDKCVDYKHNQSVVHTSNVTGSGRLQFFVLDIKAVGVWQQNISRSWSSRFSLPSPAAKKRERRETGKGGGEELKRQQFQISEERNKDSSFAPFGEGHSTSFWDPHDWLVSGSWIPMVYVTPLPFLLNPI